MAYPSKLTTIGVIASSTMNWPLDPDKNAIRSARTLVVYNVPVSMMTMKIGKREGDPSDMKDGAR